MKTWLMILIIFCFIFFLGIFVLIPLISLGLFNPGEENIMTESLQLTIKSDKIEYKHGEEIKIFYTIENKNTEAIGFYVNDIIDGLNIEVSDLSGNIYDYYFDVSAQRSMPSIYPDEYVLLNPNEKWNGNKSFLLNNGKIKEWRQGGNLTSKGNPVHLETVYEGVYIACPSGCLGNDAILLNQFSKGKIQISAKYKTGNSNPRDYTLKDCKDANISVDIFPEDFTTNIISHTVILPIYLDLHDLAIYCQHHSSLSKNAWIGTLNSNKITIEIK